MAVLDTRSGGRDEGYTLVEIATVMLVIGALLMIAVVTFLNAQQGSREKAAQTRARTALLANRSYVHDTGVLPATPDDLKAVEPSLDYTADEAARVQGKVFVRSEANEVYLGTATSDGTTCFWVRDTEANGTFYAKLPCSATDVEVEAALTVNRSW